MYEEIEILGRVGSDPELRYTVKGVAVCNFSVATVESLKKDTEDGSKRDCPAGWMQAQNPNYWEVTKWFRVTAWRGLADMAAKYLHKSSVVFVKGTMGGLASNGRMNPRVWCSADGIHRAAFEITASMIKFADRRELTDNSEPVGHGFPEEELPF